MVVTVIRIIMLVGHRNCIARCTSDNPKCLILVCCCRNQRHIISTHIVILIRQSVTVVKMRILTSQFLRPRIHQINERLIIAAKLLPHMLRDRVSTLIGRFQHNSVQALFNGKLLIQISGNMGRIAFIIIDCIC